MPFYAHAGIAFPCVERCRETVDQTNMHGYITSVGEKKTRNVNDLLWLPSTDGGAPLLVSASGDKMVRVHDVSTGQCSNSSADQLHLKYITGWLTAVGI